MARPRSEAKQQALLNAATEVMAEQGLSAPTAAIAKRAGVSEGTLFRYFETKDVLLRAVFDAALDELEGKLAASEQPASAMLLAQTVWDNYIDWSLAHPAAYSTVNQLGVSGKLSEEQIRRCMRMCDIGFGAAADIDALNVEQTQEFISTVITGIANAMIDLAMLRPEFTQIYKQAGYQSMLRAVALTAA